MIIITIVTEKSSPTLFIGIKDHLLKVPANLTEFPP